MRIFSKGTLRDFWEKHPNAAEPLKAWHERVTKASWQSPAEVKIDYHNASILPNNRVVFNIKGNDYRLIVEIKYSRQQVYICFVGTHKEYDKIDAITI